MNDNAFWYKFQSPDGDFVYSDGEVPTAAESNPFSFNPLTGISSILTKQDD